MSLVLDTSVVSALMRRAPEALGHLRGEKPGEVLLTSPVAAEIRFGIERLPEGRRRGLLEREYRQLRQIIRWQDWTEAAAEEFGRQKARLQREGRPIEDMDIAIGALAASLGARLATLNPKHLGRMTGVLVEDWRT